MNENSILLTVRGSHIPPTLDAARVLHNETAGSAPGIAAARALGDLGEAARCAGDRLVLGTPR